MNSRSVVGQQSSLASLRAATETLATTPLAGSRDELLGIVTTAQTLINAATALQARAIAQVAAIESEWAEDGTLAEVRRPLGHVALDAADLVAPALGLSHAQAQRRVDLAVRVAAGRVPVVDDARTAPEPTGLSGLHAAMAEGRVDGYRASVIAHELAEVPVDVAEAVVAALDPHLQHEPAPSLRRRCRRLLAGISPDLLRQRAERARRETGLRRWICEPGVDTWLGTFPSEDAASAWAAIDELARRLVADGRYSSIEQARGKALTDLVLAHSVGTYTVILTSPAEPERASDDAARLIHDAVPATTVGSPAMPPGSAAAAPWPDDAAPAVIGSDGAPSVSPDLARPVRGDDLVEVRGLRPSEATLVAREWLDELLTSGRTGTERRRLRRRRRQDSGSHQPDAREGSPRLQVQVGSARCHPATGALVDPSHSPAYRPPDHLAALVRARDGRCRFPGCSVAARFCDLDHVRPWPIGPTSDDNLACLCRRHHRIKQRPGWRVRMLAGAVLEWTDPAGRVRTTAPLDALHAVVLPSEATDVHGAEASGSDHEASAAVTVVEPQASVLELVLEHRVAEAPGGLTLLATLGRPRRRPAALGVVVERLHPAVPVAPCLTRGARHRTHPGETRTRHRRDWPDEPPF